MGKPENTNSPDPEWEDFVARHRHRDQEEPQHTKHDTSEKSPSDWLEDVPADVYYHDDTITCWNGKAFVSWEKWRLSVLFKNPPKGDL